MTETITPTPENKNEDPDQIFLIKILDLDDRPIEIEIPSYFVPDLEIGPKFASGATSSVYSGTFQGDPCAIKITVGKLRESKWLGKFSDDEISPELFVHYELDTDNLDVTPKTAILSSSRKLSLVVSELMEMTLSEAMFSHRTYVLENQGKIVAEMKRFRDYFNENKLLYGDINTDNIVLNLKPFKLRLVDFEDVFVAKDQNTALFYFERWDKSISVFLEIMSRKPLQKRHKIFLEGDYNDLFKKLSI